MDPFRYVVRFAAPETHYAELEARFPVPSSGPLVLFLPVWTPGSYLVREYARHVEGFEAWDLAGKPLCFEKARKNRWSVDPEGAAEVIVKYRVYCREMSVRTNWVDERFALLQGAATFLTVLGALSRPHEVKLELPTSWNRAMTGLPDGDAENTFLAADYDALVDSPILAGKPAVYQFLVDEKKHFLVNEGEDGLWDSARAVADLERIVLYQTSFWGSLPYDRFVFLNVIGDSRGGGLEHKNSFCLLSSRFATRTRAGYTKWLDLASHEFFHVWNVKRLRPASLGPFDYENENYTRELWIAEGFTEYYGSLSVRRAGLTTRDEYLETLSKTIEELQSTPGRFAQPVETSSFDAWIKLYRPDENSGNTSISYYTNGAVIAFLLDARIREATTGAKSLDDVMRLAYERYSGGRGFTSAEFRQVAHDVAGEDLRPWFDAAISTTAELDYSPALSFFGLRFKIPEASGNGWTGCTTKVEEGRLVISKVPRGTPAFQSGLSVEDEILAIGEHRVKADQWGQRMEQFHSGEKLSLLVARRERLKRIDIVLAAEPGPGWKLEVAPEATELQKSRLLSWLLL